MCVAVQTFCRLECADEVEDFVVFLYAGSISGPERVRLTDAIRTLVQLAPYHVTRQHTHAVFSAGTYAHTAVTRTARKAMR